MCSLVWFGGHRSTGGRFINNVFLVNEGSASTRMGLRTESANDETPSSWTSSAEGLTLFEGYFRRGASTDSLSQWGGTGDENLHISGLESSSSGSYDSKAISTADADTISRNELENSVGRMSGLDTDNTTIGDATACAAGTCPDTLDTRLGLALQASSYQPVSPTYDGKGVDLTDLADEQGFPGTITVTADDNDATITLHTPATAGCYFDIAPFDTSWSGTWDTAGNVTRQLNADASQTQSEQFTSLTAETKYYYRVWGGPCRKLAIGEFTTAGTP
jgi:hypothetical protein